MGTLFKGQRFSGLLGDGQNLEKNHSNTNENVLEKKSNSNPNSNPLMKEWLESGFVLLLARPHLPYNSPISLALLTPTTQVQN